MAIKKETRLLVHQKYKGCCAYCGKQIEYKDMQVDHIAPIWHNYKQKEWLQTRLKNKIGTDDFENLNPACRRCNGWKSTYTIEQFRKEISEQTERLKKRSNNYRMALDFGLITEHQPQVKFWFEVFSNPSSPTK